MKKGAFFVGAQYGQGVVTCRTGHGWSAPVFIRMEGGSFGLQFGGQAVGAAHGGKLLVSVRSDGRFAAFHFGNCLTSRSGGMGFLPAICFRKNGMPFALQIHPISFAHDGGMSR